MEAARGETAAQSLLHHDPHSKTYRLNYAKGPEQYDVYGIASGEKDMGEMALNDPQAVYRIKEWTIDRTRFIRDYVSADKDVQAAQAALSLEIPPSPESTNKLNRLKRRAYYHGHVALCRAEKDLSDGNLTADERDRRREEVKNPTKFLQRIQSISAALPQDEQQQDLELTPSYRLVDPDDENEVVNGDDEYDDVEDSTELDSLFESLVILLTTPRVAPGDEQSCPFCQEDPTISYVYTSQNVSLMRRHLTTKLHTKRAYFLRRHKELEDDAHGGEVPCPFDCGGSFYEYVDPWK